MFQDVFTEIAAVLVASACLGAIAVWLRQPLIVAFIAAGILVGPAGLGWVAAADQIDLLAKVGIALLLFIVGLKLDLNVIRSLGPVALATGLGQVVFTSVIGFAIASTLGLMPVAALYVAVALTFSSTIIIVKLLSDKREIDALHGRIAVGFLIVQDIVVVLVMIGLNGFGLGGQFGDIGHELVSVLVKGVALLAIVIVAMRYVLPILLQRLARSKELLTLFAISWAVALAAIGDALGLSKEMGAFLAGVSLASSSYREAINSRLVSLRDFLLLFFFIDLGTQLNLEMLNAQLVPAVVLSLFVLVGNPLIVMVIMGMMGYRKRTGFLAGLTVAQISEFSLILAGMGVGLGHIDSETLGLITMVGLITIGLSTYMILYSHHLYRGLARWLVVFERRIPHREQAQDMVPGQRRTDAILIGIGRYGGEIARRLAEKDWQVLAVDFDPDVVTATRRNGFAVRFGDAEDAEFLLTLPLRDVRWVINTSPECHVNLALLDGLRALDFSGRVAVRAHNTADEKTLLKAGAHLILSPFADGATKAAERLIHATNQVKFAGSESTKKEPDDENCCIQRKTI